MAHLFFHTFFAVLIIASIVALVIFPYMLSRQKIFNNATEETKDFAKSIVIKISSLHGLILALIFTQELSDIFELRQVSAREAAATADIFYDLDRYSSENLTEARLSIASYVQSVIYEEWKMLAHGKLSQNAWDLWNATYIKILDLEPTTSREVNLRERMLKDIETISESRNIRNSDSNSEIPFLFWVVALLGLPIIALTYGVFPATKHPLLLLGSYAFFNGLVLYTILVISNPFSPPAQIHPSPFLEIYEHGMQEFIENYPK